MHLRSLSSYLKEKFHTKVYRLSLTCSSTCPNRDGTISYGGCAFCSQGGSGDFAEGKDFLNFPDFNIDEQIERAKSRVNSKFPSSISPEQRKYIAYFQSFTSTWGEQERLKAVFSKVISRPEILVLSIATRPDSLSDDMISFLAELNKKKSVWIELGLQTIHQKTADSMNRGYDLSCFEECYRKLKEKNLEVIVHVILGLPGETKEMMKESVSYLASLNPHLDGIKLQLLHVLEGTALASFYEKEKFHIMTMEEYCNLVVECLKLLNPETVIHRMTGDGPKKILIEPKWSGDKKKVLNYLNALIEKS